MQFQLLSWTGIFQNSKVLVDTKGRKVPLSSSYRWQQARRTLKVCDVTCSQQTTQLAKERKLTYKRREVFNGIASWWVHFFLSAICNFSLCSLEPSYFVSQVPQHSFIPDHSPSHLSSHQTPGNRYTSSLISPNNHGFRLISSVSWGSSDFLHEPPQPLLSFSKSELQESSIIFQITWMLCCLQSSWQLF